MSINLLDDVAPASNELGAIADMAQQMYDLQTEIIQDKESLKQKEQDLKKLAEQNLPDLMQELNIKDFTLNNGAKIKVDDIVSASIPSTGSIERADGHERMELEMRQQQCFDWLRSNNAGSMSKVMLRFSLQKTRTKLAMNLLKNFASEICSIVDQQESITKA